MDAVNYSTFRDNMKEYCDKVCETGEAYIVTRKADQGNVVVISIEEYNDLMRIRDEKIAEYIKNFRHKTYAERLAECGGKTNPVLFDWGEPVGREIF